MNPRIGVRTALTTSVSALVIACAATTSNDVDPSTPPEEPSNFNQNDAALPDANGPRLGQCPTNECPAGHITCPTNPFPCAVDLTSDDDNCGACGHRCVDFQGTSLGDLHASMQCANGRCLLACSLDWGNCNGFVEDGCEAPLFRDKNNCGQCGNACTGLDECVNGQCLCPIDFSCGTCGNVCPPALSPPPPATGLPFPPAWNAWYDCVLAECYQPACKPGWGDCNRDFDPLGMTGDGCERVIVNDPANCGACGKKCGPGEICVEDDCVCPCGSPCFAERILTDVGNCGACGVNCTSSGAHQTSFCDRGICSIQCDPYWADCDDTYDCETNLLVDPMNCGACGIRCDGIDGQACVDGKCTTTECQPR